MKIRTDFVTNSSSSSFVVAKKGNFTEEQKKWIIDYVTRECFGEKCMITIEEIDAYQKVQADADHADVSCQQLYSCSNCPGKKICDMYISDDKLDKIKDALRQGMDIYHGVVSFEFDCSNNADMMSTIWSMLEKNNNGNFMGIKTDLSY